MLKYIKEFRKCIEIAGFSDVKIGNEKDFLKRIEEVKPPNVEIQFFNAAYVAGWQHLYFAVLNALTAFKNKGNISKSLAIEIMVYASAQRQIRKAMGLLGISSKTLQMAAVIVGGNPKIVKSALSVVSEMVNGKRDDKVLGLNAEKIRNIQKVFGISDLELKTIMRKNDVEEALIKSVIERMALLATQH
ncbi:MAG: KEOPS complex subunit Cgi121 [Candidatus Bathyarchaeia archaeon]